MLSNDYLSILCQARLLIWKNKVRKSRKRRRKGNERVQKGEERELLNYS